MTTFKTPTIAAAWDSYRALVLPEDATQIQVDECRLAFYAGAATLFHSIMRMLDPGKEATDRDLARMSAIADEIDAFAATFDAEVIRRKTRDGAL